MADIVEGIPQFDKALEDIILRVNEAALEFVKRGAEEIKIAAQKRISGNSTDKWHSTAWPVPTRWTGNLANSIYMDSATSDGRGTAQSTTGPHTVYGRRIELGYHGTGQFPYYTTRPFPYLQPGIKDAMPALDQLFTETVIAAQEA